MKKVLTGLITAALVLSCTSMGASAHHRRAAVDLVCGGLQSGHIRPTCVGQWNGYGHICVDEDHDGICDHYDPEYCPGNGMMGNGFVDADNDGVCDNYVSQGHHNNGWRSGRGNGRHGRHCS